MPRGLISLASAVIFVKRSCLLPCVETMHRHLLLTVCFLFIQFIPALWAGNGRLVRVALFNDDGAFGLGVPRITEQLAQTNDIKVTKVSGKDIVSGALKDFDVVIFSGGSGSKESAAIGEAGREEVRRFVREGGGYIGICAGAY